MGADGFTDESTAMPVVPLGERRRGGADLRDVGQADHGGDRTRRASYPPAVLPYKHPELGRGAASCRVGQATGRISSAMSSTWSRSPMSSSCR